MNLLKFQKGKQRESEKFTKIQTSPSLVCRHVDVWGKLGRKMRPQAKAGFSPQKAGCNGIYANQLDNFREKSNHAFENKRF